MGQTFLPRFQRMVAELRAHPRIEVTEARVSRGASRPELEAARGAAGGRLPEGVEDFYSEMNGFVLEWEEGGGRAGGGGDIVKGSVEILPVRELTKDWLGVTWFAFEGGERFKGVKPFDFFSSEACAALVRSGPEGFAPTVHYHYLGELLCDTGYGFTEFIDRLLNARGFWYWVESLCPDTRKSPEAKNFLRQMPLLFEDFQPALVRPGLPE